MEKLDAAYEGQLGLARLNQICRWRPLPQVSQAQQVRNEDRIPIITIHRQRGSEFDHCFLTDLNEGTFLSPFALAKAEDDEESAYSMWL